MASATTTVKAIRMPNEVCDWVNHENIPLRSIMESLYSHVQAGRIVVKGGELVLSQNADISGLSKYGITEDIVADFNEILNLCGMDFEEFFQRLYAKVEAGEIDIMDMV